MEGTIRQYKIRGVNPPYKTIYLMLNCTSHPPVYRHISKKHISWFVCSCAYLLVQDVWFVDLFFLGHRAPHECIDAFFVELTKDSVVAVKEAQKRVAADWRSGFHSRGIQAEPKRRKKQIRCFRTAARWKAAGKTKPIEKKSSVAVAKKVAICSRSRTRPPITPDHPKVPA